MESVPAGIICSAKDYAQSLHDPTIYCLRRSDTIGAVLTVEAGFVSILALVYVFGLIARNVLWRFKHMPTARLRLFHQPMDVLMFSLLLADAVQAVGVIVTLHWVRDGKTEVGSFCNAQAIVKMLGATTVAFSTGAITIFTFIAVWVQKSITSIRATVFVVIGIWLFAAFIATLGITSHSVSKPVFITPTPYWCYVGSHYVVWRLLAEYLWMWTALFFSVVVYIPLYFWMRGNIEVDPGAWWKPRLKWTPERDLQIVAVRRRSLTMLAYPIVYSLSIMPLSVVRWAVYVQEAQTGASQVPPVYTFIAVSIFGLSGFFNVILLLTTRRTSGLFGELIHSAPSRAPIIFFRNDRETRDHSAKNNRSKASSKIYDEIYVEQEVHTM